MLDAVSSIFNPNGRFSFFLTLTGDYSIFLEKAIKLKQAKEEAKIEIGKFTKEREAQFKVSYFLFQFSIKTLFKAKEAEILGGRNELEASILADTEQKLGEMNARVQQFEQAVINELVSQVCNSNFDQLTVEIN